MTLDKPTLMEWFGLERDPFAKRQTAGDTWKSVALRAARSLVKYAVAHQEMVALLGVYGTGKTTAKDAALAALDDGTLVAEVLVDKDGLTVAEIEEAMLDALDADRVPRTRGPRRRLLRELLIQNFNAGRRMLVVIDEAHRVRGSTMKALKELQEHSRYAHMEALFSVLLVGHRQLPGLLAWQARDVLARLEAHNIVYLARLDPRDAGEYIKHRLVAAGAAALIPAPEALAAIVRRATPVGLNKWMWQLLEAACVAGEKEITAARVAALAPGGDGETQTGADGPALDKLLDGGRDAERDGPRGGADAAGDAG